MLGIEGLTPATRGRVEAWEGQGFTFDPRAAGRIAVNPPPGGPLGFPGDPATYLVVAHGPEGREVARGEGGDLEEAVRNGIAELEGGTN